MSIADGHSGHTGHEHEHPAGHGDHTHPASHDHDHDQHGGGGHGGHNHGDHAALFRDRFWWSLALAVPVVVFSRMFGDILGYRIGFPGAGLISPVLGTAIFAYGGWPFLTGALAELRGRRPGMMTLIAMAIGVAFLASWATVFDPGLELDFWWELALLVVIMLLGHWIEMRALGAASGALDALAGLLPDTAEVIRHGEPSAVPLAELAVGDTVLVRAGARVPADGRVVEGEAELDESMITGESRTVSRGVGSAVVAGTIATDSALRVEVTAVGEGTALAGIRRLIDDAQRSSSRAQALADRAAALLFYFAAGAGVITFIVWLLLGSPADAIQRTVTVLVIACPHALGLAIPLVIALSTERAARAGVLVKDRLALERMRTVDVVLFDKTGTLTTGEPALRHVVADGIDETDAVRLAAAAEAASEHPLARALVRAAGAAGAGPLPPASGFRSRPALGVEAKVDGAPVRVGGPRLLAESAPAVPAAIAAAVSGWQAEGATVLYLMRAERLVAAFALEDAVRPESAATVRALHERGVTVAMITGDAAAVADSVAAELDADEVFAEVLPADKDAKVAEL
ncbi:MAG TPA: heavy metal translocating P-type ATPase, partial [Gryllotalpicola sp.]